MIAATAKIRKLRFRIVKEWLTALSRAAIGDRQLTRARCAERHDMVVCLGDRRQTKHNCGRAPDLPAGNGEHGQPGDAIMNDNSRVALARRHPRDLVAGSRNFGPGVDHPNVSSSWDDNLCSRTLQAAATGVASRDACPLSRDLTGDQRAPQDRNCDGTCLDKMRRGEQV